MLEPAPDLSEVVMSDALSFKKPVIGGEFVVNNIRFLVLEDGEVYMSLGELFGITNALIDDYEEWKKAHGTTE